MRLRVLAVSAATLVAAATLVPTTAVAAGGNTLYVSSNDPSCSDNGSGTYAVPFCSIQAAANVVSPGDVVEIELGSYAPVTITRSGTASAPITFTGYASQTGVVGNDANAASDLTLSGASYINVESLTTGQAATAEIAIDGGSNITISHVSAKNVISPHALHITGGASAVTVVDSYFFEPVLIDGGATGTVFTTNETTAPVAVAGATNTAITSNTLNTCGSAISVTNSSTATSIENNVVDNFGTDSAGISCTTAAYGILVDASSATGTTSDYNDVDEINGTADYDWSGTAYATQSAFNSQTTQGAHDVDGAGAVSAVEGSAIINSANSDAIGEQTTDYRGDARFLDPTVTPTGSGTYDYYDRGAIQFQDPLTITAHSYSGLPEKMPVGTTVDLSASATDTWGDTDLTYAYSVTPSAGATLNQPSASSGNATVSFSASGSYNVTVYVKSAKTGALERYLASSSVVAAPVTPLTASFTASRGNGKWVEVADSSTDDWTVTGVSWNFGDGTGPIGGSPCCAGDAYTNHEYATPGTYQITETVTDADGEKATSTQSFTTMEVPANSLVTWQGSPVVVTEGGLVTPTASGVSKSAVAVMPDGSTQYVAVTTGGVLEHDIYYANGSWQGWRTLSQPGVTVTEVGIAGMPNGSSQITEVLSNGTIRHNIRFANGSWQKTGWGSLGGPNFVQVGITAMPDGSAQLVAVTASGVLEHNIRYANSWQGWRVLSQPGVTITDASIVGMPDGSSQLVEITSAGVMKHNIRYANGSWQKTGWGVPPGSTGLSRVSIARLSNGTFMLATTTTGALEEDVRFSAGRWATWQTFDETVTGTVSDPAVSELPNSFVVVSLVTAGG
ncbi:PKD domain-containing protein [Actinospica sp.]|jgi:hypothetical protein|uniref:PKD domain-containing protein n=1 Tax=Actinospica sp. TaxID=1872142 RepID=UPI002C22F6EA|nr:PKD domain-containing protein [Actinospica sp.]HWG22748.1 PKD domain-containing protein [Actinospica sp.]